MADGTLRLTTIIPKGWLTRMSDIGVPAEGDFMEAFGATPVLLAGGEATYLVEVASGGRELLLSYDVVERSVRVKIRDGAMDSVDLYYEGLDTISLTGGGSTAGLTVTLSGTGYLVRVHVAVFPILGIRSEVLAG
ncbi:hypothetical protein ACQPZF_11165 [Actinosynnema sp. CS-041913]|uniref:hypothetical protein n=1 Tax=Actinosynnema sp. CS-041913 TaxID=3239917 RepID=UPI003D8C576A